MKRIFIFATLLMLLGFSASAQSHMVVNTEAVFKSLTEFTEVNDKLTKLTEKYQKSIDEAYAEVEKMYTVYVQQRPQLSESTRTAREEAIIKREKEIQAYQERVFGQDGELMKKRAELMKPIQDRVFNAINSYAERNGYTLVMDISSNPSVLYYSPKVDKTEEIKALLGVISVLK